jgi:phage baseplate assembly protein gpV/phage protein D
VSAIETLPRLTIELGGLALDEDAAMALRQVRVLQKLSLPALCELTFREPRGGLASAEEFLPGAALRVRVNDVDEALFVGEVTAISHRYGPANEREVCVRAYDPMHRLRKRQPVRAFVELHLRDLANEVAGDLGFSICMDDPGPVWPRIMQWQQSDLELLSEVAARCGLYLTIRGDELHFVSLEGSGAPVDLELGDTLLEATCDATTEPACRSVNVHAWDAWTTTEYEAVADAARVGRSIELDIAPDSVGSPGRRTLVDEMASTDAHAAVLAQAELDRRVAGEVTVQGVAVGNPQLRPGQPVNLRGLAGPFAGRYVVTATVHTVDRVNGFRTQFETTPPTTLARARACVTTLGVILDVDDPRKIGRVRVSLPGYCDLETDWLEVLAPGAGRGKGLVAVPDTGDRVLLILPRGDPAQAVVLGGLFAADGPPDTGVRDRRVLRYTFVTRAGQRLYLEEEHKTVRMENGTGSFLEIAPGATKLGNSDGSFIELTRERLHVHANADLEITAPGKTVIFRSAKVDFRTG